MCTQHVVPWRFKKEKGKPENEVLTWWRWLFTCPQRSCYWSGSLCQDPAGNQTTWRPDHRKNCGGMVTSPVHQVWPQPSCKAQWKGEEDKADKRKRWDDSIREWTGLEFAKSQRAVENREKWRKKVVKSSVVPLWPLHLRNRWWWWCWWFVECLPCLVDGLPCFYWLSFLLPLRCGRLPRVNACESLKRRTRRAWPASALPRTTVSCLVHPSTWPSGIVNTWHDH